MPVRMMLKREFPESFNGKRWTYRTDVRECRVMAQAEGYAMVRFKGCLPFVVSVKDLSPLPKPE